MRIVIDATPVGLATPDKGGVNRYVRELILALAALDSENSYTLFFDLFSSENRRAMAAEVQRLNLPPHFRPVRAKFPPSLTSRFPLPLELQVGGFDLVHGTFDRFPKTLGGRRVVTIHDVRYLEEDLGALEGSAAISSAHVSAEAKTDYDNRERLFEMLRKSIPGTVASADAVITISEYSKSRIVEKLGVAPEKVRVIYHGIPAKDVPVPADRIAAVQQRLGVTGSYLLYVSKFDPLKNIGRILEAYLQTVGSHDLPLVMCGPENWYTPLVRARVQELGLGKRVIFPGFIEDALLPALYSGATALVLPSLYEGFCLPVLESMACGTPVITANRTSLPEVTDGAALMVNPESVDEIAHAIETIVGDATLQSKLAEAGQKRAATFSWSRCARQTLDLYQSLLRKGKS